MGSISVFGEEAGDRGNVLVQVAAVGRQAVLARGQAGVQRGPRGRTHRIGRVGPAKVDAIGGQPVQVGGPDFVVAVPAQAETVHLVDDDDKEVGVHGNSLWLQVGKWTSTGMQLSERGLAVGIGCIAGNAHALTSRVLCVPVRLEGIQHGHAGTVEVADIAGDYRQPMDEGGSGDHKIDVVVPQGCRQMSPALCYCNIQGQNPGLHTGLAVGTTRHSTRGRKECCGVPAA